MTTLFRDEAIRAQQSHYLGTIRLGRKKAATAMTFAASVFAMSLIAYVGWGEATRKTTLNGILVPAGGTLNISAPQTGTLVELRVKEGDEISSNQVLMVVSIDKTTSEGNAAVLIAQAMDQRRIALTTERTLAQSQFHQRQQAAEDRIRSLESDARQAEGEIDSAKRRLELARKTLERFSDLAKSGFVADIQVQQKQEDLLDLIGRESNAERSLTAVQRDILGLRSDERLNQGALQSQLLEIEKSLAALSQESTENSAHHQLTIVAPQAGVLTAVTADLGQLVQPGQTLAVIVPKSSSGDRSSLVAQLYAPSRSIGFVRKGQVVWLRYSAYPYQKFGMARGVIENVSRTPISAQDLPAGQSQALMSAAQTNEPLYRITVKVDSQSIETYGQPQSLRPGMTFSADVIQERRKIWQWIFEPVIASSGLSNSFAGKAK